MSVQKKKVAKPVVTANPDPIVIPEIESNDPYDTFEISNVTEAWIAWAKGSYDDFQPFNELIDNAMAAIMDSSTLTGRLYIRFDFDHEIGSIEHSGGTTFPHTSAELVRCFTYGGKKPTSLNEHGCGLKTSLAILDPENIKWRIYIKYMDDNGDLQIISVRAPYSSKMQIFRETVWPGENKTAEPGSYILFPIKKNRFKDLYSSEDAKMIDLHTRIPQYFSHIWMEMDPYVDGKIQIHYNGEIVPPFSFYNRLLVDYIEDTHYSDFTLSTGAMVKIAEIKLRKSAKKIPGSNLFKYSMTSNGAYIFKNGRLIHTINHGADYLRLFGSNPHNNHNGHIKIINMIGKQEDLPATVPTKNRFGNSLLYDECIDGCRAKFKLSLQTKEQGSEESDVIEYESTRKKMYEADGMDYQSFRERKFSLSNGTLTPPIDLVEFIGATKCNLYEFKKDTKMSCEHISQLFTNWSVATQSDELKGKQIIPILMLRPMDNNENCISDTNRSYLQIFQDLYKFNPVVRNLKNTTIYPAH